MTDVIVEKNVPVPMQDGIRLFADIFRPGRQGRYPVLLQRTPYSKERAQMTYLMLDPLRAVGAGYVVVIQDTRGRYASEGEFVPFPSESQDGFDTVEWCAAQPWSSGKVGMYGMSYVGATQWLAAIAAPPHLVTLFPVMTAADYHDGWIYQGGALSLAFATAWTAQFLAIPQLDRLGVSLSERQAEEARLMQALE